MARQIYGVKKLAVATLKFVCYSDFNLNCVRWIMNKYPQQFEPMRKSHLDSVPCDLIAELEQSDFDDSIRLLVNYSADYVYGLLVRMIENEK